MTDPTPGDEMNHAKQGASQLSFFQTIPPSQSTVQVRIIDTDTLIYINPKLFCEPEIDGFAGFNAPIYCFLISNGDRHVLFDLGVRPDWKNYAPSIVSVIEATTTVTVGSDVASVLDSDTSGLNFRRADIKSIIWSHSHFDHIGDMSQFPGTTELVVGPGVRETLSPGWPQVSDAKTLETDIRGRNVREISFDQDLSFGDFEAFDFFGDGSFYLLDAPGHATGHLCAAARCTADPPSFVLMGADACHHPGIIRPTEYLPLPQSQASGQTLETPRNPMWCPGDVLHRLTLDGTPKTPFQRVAHGPLFLDHDAAMETVNKIQKLDATDNVFVLLAHDLSLRTEITFFPAAINDWLEKDIKNRTRWLFCADFDKAVERIDGSNAKYVQ